MRWRLILEEYNPELIYLPGDKNIVAHALSRLELTTDDLSITNFTPVLQNEIMAGSETLNSLEELSNDAFALTYKTIAAEQQQDKLLINKVKTDSN